MSWLRRMLEGHEADLLALLLAILYGLPALGYPFGSDQALHAYIGAGILEGQVPYLEGGEDIKPVGIYLVHAAAFALFGDHQWSIRVVELGTVLLIGWLLARLVREDGRGWGASVLLMTGFYYTSFDYWHSAQQEVWQAALLLAAVVIAIRDPRPARRALGSGALCGAAFMLKFTAVVPALGVFLLCWRSAGWSARAALGSDFLRPLRYRGRGGGCSGNIAHHRSGRLRRDVGDALGLPPALRRRRAQGAQLDRAQRPRIRVDYRGCRRCGLGRFARGSGARYRRRRARGDGGPRLGVGVGPGQVLPLPLDRGGALPRGTDRVGRRPLVAACSQQGVRRRPRGGIGLRLGPELDFEQPLELPRPHREPGAVRAGAHPPLRLPRPLRPRAGRVRRTGADRPRGP
ncbi:MAG: glycosyltransferase family 39 protein [Deltaproteobacteria bacterium]|nr:glycosyltransferase family 39 protein [Deltaproteobacteria bacterium]